MRHAGIYGVLMFAVGACGFGAIGNGDVTSTSRPVSGFNRVVADSSAAVKVREGLAYAVTVTTDSNLQRRVETWVQGDTLVVDQHELFSATELRVDIQMPTFRAGTLAGSGAFDVEVTNPHDVDLILSGSGTVAFSGPAAAVAASLTGSGTLRLAGSADSLTASLDGSGELDARALPANRATLDLGGSGRLQATALQSVALRLGGSGDIDWWGPATVSSSIDDGSGRIAHH